MATKTSTPPKPKLLKILGIAAVVLVLLGIGTYLFLIQREKAQFAQAEKEMDALYAQIVEKVGKPDQEKKERSCGYASRVYGKGPLSCSTHRSASFKVANTEEANVLMKKSVEIVGTKLYGPFGKSNQQSFIGEVNKFDEELGQDLTINSLSGGRCGIKYVYPLSASKAVSQKFASEGNLKIFLSCGAPTMREYFPVKD